MSIRPQEVILPVFGQIRMQTGDGIEVLTPEECYVQLRDLKHELLNNRKASIRESETGNEQEIDTLAEVDIALTGFICQLYRGIGQDQSMFSIFETLASNPESRREHSQSWESAKKSVLSPNSNESAKYAIVATVRPVANEYGSGNTLRDISVLAVLPPTNAESESKRAAKIPSGRRQNYGT